jgi:hypothetical protein
MNNPGPEMTLSLATAAVLRHGPVADAAHLRTLGQQDHPIEVKELQP